MHYLSGVRSKKAGARPAFDLEEIIAGAISGYQYLATDVPPQLK